MLDTEDAVFMQAYLSHCHKQPQDLTSLPGVLSFSQGQESNKTGYLAL